MRMQNEEHCQDMALLAQQQAWEGALPEHRSTGAPRLGAGRLMCLRNGPLFLEAAESLGSSLGSQALRAERRNGALTAQGE